LIGCLDDTPACHERLSECPVRGYNIDTLIEVLIEGCTVADTRSLLTGIALGVGATLAARDVLPLLAPLARPALKQGVKAALLGYERGREMAALLVETLSDIAAEVQVELHTQGAVEPAPVDVRIES
jgi:hypothetical protein